MSDDLIQKLREELARYQDLNRQLCDKSNRSTIMIARLEEQLAEAQKQNVMLREAIDSLVDFGTTVGGSSSYWEEVWPEKEEALAATQDLSGLVLCEAEPVAWMFSKGTITKLDTWEHGGNWGPLYKARKAK